MASCSFAIGKGVRMPATTSSPCASMRNSPKSSLVPELGSRVKQTPVPLVSPMLPYAMAWTLTAVPSKPLMFSTSRYLTARAPIHPRKTADMASLSCSRTFSGKVRPLLTYTFLKRSTIVLRSSTNSSESSRTPHSNLTSSISSSNAERGISNTTLPNISRNLRYESHANRSLPVLAARPWHTSSFIPKLRTVVLRKKLILNIT
mmetsp:Transcript_19688/g.39955  ORF Transcript_19688/g.39955 Transcript_19688/m.39955 type:complete len:204 (-) Transcript_19688:44-655(-)